MAIYNWLAINTSATGDNTIVPGVAGQRVSVVRLWFTVDADTLITFKDGSTPFTGPINFVDSRSITLSVEDEPWFVTGLGNAFIINQTGTAQISGKIDFLQP